VADRQSALLFAACDLVAPVEESSPCLIRSMPYPPAARSVPIAAFIRELDALVGETMAEWKIPGLAIAVVQNGDVALLQGYGRRDV
jgi:CubicO group peptidase (beta-lactamase class C family)